MKPRAIIFDLDGTIYRGDTLLPGSQEIVSYCLAQDIQVRFFTNNSTISPNFVCERLRRLGIISEADWVITSGMLAASYCKNLGLSKLEVIGEDSLCHALQKAGLFPYPSPCREHVDAVVCGLDREISYDKLSSALEKLLAGAEYIATNADATFPLADGCLAPGAGAIVSALSTSSGRSPKILGKPEPTGVLRIADSLMIPASDILMVGDRYDTDIECGRRAGAQTWMVLTGVSSEIPYNQPGSSTLQDLLDHLKAL